MRYTGSRHDDEAGSRPLANLLRLVGGLALSAIVFLSAGIRFSCSLFLYGAFMPLAGAMTSALAGDIFGRYSVGSLFGLVVLSHQSGAALGAWLGGVGGR